MMYSTLLAPLNGKPSFGNYVKLGRRRTTQGGFFFWAHFGFRPCGLGTLKYTLIWAQVLGQR
jgi:hypothetical protein